MPKQTKETKMQETNGALPPETPTPAPAVPEAPKHEAISASLPHQTHGAVLPTGPITSVSQLIAGYAKGSTSIGAFDTLQNYTKYLNTLSLASLHRHALEEAKMVPIDDRDRLIRRLEGEWSTAVARSPGRRLPTPPQPRRYTQAEMDTLTEIKDKLLKRR